MSNQVIVNQIESEIARLGQQLEELETRKTRLKVAIRNHRSSQTPQPRDRFQRYHKQNSKR